MTKTALDKLQLLNNYLYFIFHISYFIIHISYLKKLNHQIGKTSLTIRASRKADGFALQTAVSEWFWQALLPELSLALDAVVPPDVVVRLERLDIELPMTKLSNWREQLGPSVCRAIVEEITRRRLFPSPTEAPVGEMSVSENGFSAWLGFIETGRKPMAIGDFEIWQKATLAAVATSPIALARLNRVLADEPKSLERLIRQHDALFLGQLMEAITGKSAAEIRLWYKAFENLLHTEGVLKMLSLAVFDSRAIHFSFWQLIYEETTKRRQTIDYQEIGTFNFFVKLINPLSRQSLSKAEWTELIFIFFEQKLKGASFKTQNPKPKTQNTEGPIPLTKEKEEPTDERAENLFKAKKQREQALKRREAQTVFFEKEWADMLKQVTEKEQIERLFKPLMTEIEAKLAKRLDAESKQIEPTKRASKPSVEESAVLKKKEADNPDLLSENKKRKPESLTQTEGENTEKKAEKAEQSAEKPTLAEGESLYVGMAGVVLLHPFIEPFFRALDLLGELDFVDEAARLRGVGLLQYLSVGDADVVEYDAALLKWFCNVPFETPIDSRLDLTEKERKEANELLETIIKYWGALGEVSAESLQEGFLQRDGKLMKRGDGWLLQVEKQTIDILLDRLPWGFGVIKMPWQSEMLFVEW
jgi:hypothetical protein